MNIPTKTLDELQQLMDKQQDSHERLLVGREPYGAGLADAMRKTADKNARLDDPYGRMAAKVMEDRQACRDAYEQSREGPHHPIMKSYTSSDRPIYVPGKGLTFYVKDVWEATSPIRGEIVIIDGQEYRVNWVSGFRSDAAKELYLEIGTTTPQAKPIPAPQKQDLPQGDTKTAAEEIDALKRRIKALENYLWGMRESADEKVEIVPSQ